MALTFITSSRGRVSAVTASELVQDPTLQEPHLLPGGYTSHSYSKGLAPVCIFTCACPAALSETRILQCRKAREEVFGMQTEE